MQRDPDPDGPHKPDPWVWLGHCSLETVARLVEPSDARVRKQLLLHAWVWWQWRCIS